MIGSTIVFIPELPQDKSTLFDRIVEKEEFKKIELDYLTTIDFEIITRQNNTNWHSENNPVFYDENNGLVICHISKIGLTTLIEFNGELDNIDKKTLNSDILKLKDFYNQYGGDNLYELVTF